MCTGKLVIALCRVTDPQIYLNQNFFKFPTAVGLGTRKTGPTRAGFVFCWKPSRFPTDVTNKPNHMWQTVPRCGTPTSRSAFVLAPRTLIYIFSGIETRRGIDMFDFAASQNKNAPYWSIRRGMFRTYSSCALK